MTKKALKVVYYSLFLQGPMYEEELSKHVHSVRSLREHNSSIPVALEVYGKRVPRKYAEALKSLRVSVRLRGSLSRAFKELCPGLPVRYLLMYPPAHKWLLAKSASARGCDQILYLDNDTLVLRDVAELFERFRKYDWCAREEPHSKLSNREFDPRIFDDREYDRLLEIEGTGFISPFNSGIVLLSGSAVRGWRRTSTGISATSGGSRCGCAASRNTGGNRRRVTSIRTRSSTGCATLVTSELRARKAPIGGPDGSRRFAMVLATAGSRRRSRSGWFSALWVSAGDLLLS